MLFFMYFSKWRKKSIMIGVNLSTQKPEKMKKIKNESFQNSILSSIKFLNCFAQLAGAIEYPDCTSAEE